MDLEQINREIYRRYKNGEDCELIGKDYDLSYSQVYQILDRIERNKTRKTEHIDELVEASKLLGSTVGYARLLENKLRHDGYLENNKWRKMTDEEIAAIPGLGYRATQIITLAKTL